eukprot:CAMPEP_0183740674 /NCGR_PEP_ID=MMETSP0737-20130205/60215_1 /TAXON_ID=385413 /ORGANISM="Thalassiosira miniscula, Strain CCMP1093" /LENGTH=421 /DNA_ID=CAMNT_0025975801 /DNA_START=168 /DNA_END=1430 /DNA_ORIENTATION=-
MAPITPTKAISPRSVMSNHDSSTERTKQSGISDSSDDNNGCTHHHCSHHHPPSSTPNPTKHNIRDYIHRESRGYDIHSPTNVKKRSAYLSWNDYFLAVAYLSARRSKDPHPCETARNGACIVDSVGRIVGIGYDGFPRGCSDDCLPWASAPESLAEAGAVAGASPTKRRVSSHTALRTAEDESDNASKSADNATIITNQETTAENDITPEELAWLQTKEPYLCRAEINAILNKCSTDVVGGRMFVPNFPNNECAKFIIQSGITEVAYARDDNADSDASRASRILFEVAGVRMTRIRPSVPSVRINFGTSASSTMEELRSKNATRNEDEMETHLGLLQREASMNPFDFKVQKRADYLSWDDYFMGVAFLSAQRSKDPNTQVGACIVDANHCIIGIGYNGFPRGCSDEVLPWARSAPCDLQKK